MIYYPIDILVKAGITELLVITTGEQQPMFRKAIGNGEQFGCKVTYAIQNDPNGIADATNIAADFIGKDGVCLITGDTIIDGPDFSAQIKKSIRAVKKSGNATIFVENKTYEDQYGRVVMDKRPQASEHHGRYGCKSLLFHRQPLCLPQQGSEYCQRDYAFRTRPL